MNIFSRVYERIAALVKRLLGSPEWTFGILASIFGLLIIFLMPPFTGADEEAHFVRAYGISEGNFLISQGESVQMPESYRKTLGCLQSKQATPGELYTYKYGNYGHEIRETIGCIGNVENNTDKEPVYTTAAGYAPIAYIPQTTAIVIAKSLNAPIAITAYLVRISVLITYIALVCLAIKVLPTRKWALVGIALLPHSMMQITNPGADYILLGGLALYLAIILRSVSHDRTMPVKTRNGLLIIVATLALLLVLPKGIFPGICFLPLVFFFGGIKNYFKTKSAIFLSAGVAGYMWQRISFSSGVTIAGDGVNSIFDFPHAFVKTMFYGWINSDFIYSRIGLGLDAVAGMPAVAITIMNILLAIYLFVQYSSDNKTLLISKIETRLLAMMIVATALLVILGSFAALYIAGSYLQDESDIIKGVQARYFYPAFFLLAVVPFKRVFTSSLKTYAAVVFIGSLILLLAQSLAIAVHFY